MNGFLSWIRQLDFEYLLATLIVAAAAILCITIHETCHGLMALALGDDTAKRNKRLSLNPLRHIDLMGLVMIVLVRFGWAKPVPVDPRRFRRPKVGMMLTAFAGPVSNILLALVARILWYVWFVFVPFERKLDTGFLYYIRYFLECVAVISAGLAVFNLFPVPPLDGSKILFAILPDRWYMSLMRYERYGMLVLVALLVSGVLDTSLLFLRSALIDGLDAMVQPLFYYVVNHLV